MGWALCRVLRDKVRAPKTPPPLVLTVGMGAERMRRDTALPFLWHLVYSSWEIRGKSSSCSFVIESVEM